MADNYEETHNDEGQLLEVPKEPQKPAAVANQAKLSVQQFVNHDTVQKRVHKMLGDRAPQFTTALIAATNNIAHLDECTPASVLNAALTVAALDLPINNNLGFAYIIPYKNKGVYEAQFQMGYKGYIQLAQRSGQYKTISAAPVYEGQLIAQNPLTGNTYNWETKASDKVVGYIGYFKLINGFEKEWWMSAADIEKHARRYSQSYRAYLDKKVSSAIWHDDYDAMAMKTVLKLLISKFGPMSVDMQSAIEKDQSVDNDTGTAYPDHISEIEEKIQGAVTTGEIEEIMSGLSVSDQKRLTPAAQARAQELEG